LSSKNETKKDIKEIKELLKSSDEARRAEAVKLYEAFRLSQGGSYNPQTTPEPPGQITLPDDGRPQPKKGALKDARTWNVVTMKDDPSLFKIVDSNNVNVADQFHTHVTAEQYIAYFKLYPNPQPEPEPEEPGPGQEQCPPGSHWDAGAGKCVPDSTEPPTGPTTGGGSGSSTTKDGVTVPFRIKGDWDYAVREDWRDGGARFNMSAKGTSVVLVGAFTMDKDGGDEVSAKLLGGSHNDRQPYDGCVYDLGIKQTGKSPRMRCECPHPKYSDSLGKGTDGKSYVKQWVLTMATAIQETAGVRIQYYQDAGDASTSPANTWVKLYEYFDTGQDKPGDAESDKFPIRKLVGSAQNTWRIDNAPGLKQKWLAVAEIDTTAA
jgi:hypothetical protein